MSQSDLSSPEPLLATRNPSAGPVDPTPAQRRIRRPAWMQSRAFKVFAYLLLVAIVLGTPAVFFAARYWVRNSTRQSLPQTDGTLALSGLSASVTVQRDAHGVPHIHAGSVDDLVLAQGFVTAQDRLFQMDLLRRHAAGDLAEILGQSVIAHDRLQRTLQLRAAADRAIARLPPAQLHLLQRYAEGVNAAIARQTPHLPIEFRVLRFQPAPWTPRDSVLITLVMFQDLTTVFPEKLARESLVARLKPDLAAQLEQDLYPVGSWRDHPPTTPIKDLSVEGPPIEDIPLDESQSSLTPPAPARAPFMAHFALSGSPATPTPDSILATLQPWLVAASPSRGDSFHLTPGSNNWVVSGAHTASGKPLLANDMHLTHSLPGIWYEASLEAPLEGSPGGLHVTGVSIPGLPFIVVGHNGHIAWGFTSLLADAQDIYVESVRGSGAGQEFLATDGSWQPVLHLAETIRVHGSKDVALDVPATRHGDAVTPILNGTLTPRTVGSRTLSLRWSIYDPATLQFPLLELNAAHDWPGFLAAMTNFGSPPVNAVYGDDQGHIGFHVIGRIPLRGAPAGPASGTISDLPASISTPIPARSTTQSPSIAANPSPLAATDIQAQPAPSAPLASGRLSPVPMVPSAAREWTGYIPFDQLPQIFDPPGGILATANSRTTPDDYRFPITLDWGAPYRNDRIWHVLAHRQGLKPEDMLAIQSDVYSDFDHVLAQRLAYALDNALDHPAAAPANAHPARSAAELKTLHQAADLLRTFNGRMTVESPAAAVLLGVHTVIWPMLLGPHLQGMPSAPAAPGKTAETDAEINQLYQWEERDYALEQILMHTPPRWLPANYPNWNEFLTDAVIRGLVAAKAPADLSNWHYGAIHTLDIEHPIFAQSQALRYLLGQPTGTGPQPQSGDGTTIKQVGHTFGPSERFTADLGDLDHSTLNLVLGQSGNPMSPWFLDQFQAWYRGSTFPLPFTPAAVNAATTHTLTLSPR